MCLSLSCLQPLTHPLSHSPSNPSHCPPYPPLSPSSVTLTLPGSSGTRADDQTLSHTPFRCPPLPPLFLPHSLSPLSHSHSLSPLTLTVTPVSQARLEQERLIKEAAAFAVLKLFNRIRVHIAKRRRKQRKHAAWLISRTVVRLVQKVARARWRRARIHYLTVLKRRFVSAWRKERCLTLAYPITYLLL